MGRHGDGLCFGQCAVHSCLFHCLQVAVQLAHCLHTTLGRCLNLQLRTDNTVKAALVAHNTEKTKISSGREANPVCSQLTCETSVTALHDLLTADAVQRGVGEGMSDVSKGQLCHPVHSHGLPLYIYAGPAGMQRHSVCRQNLTAGITGKQQILMSGVCRSLSRICPSAPCYTFCCCQQAC